MRRIAVLMTAVVAVLLPVAAIAGANVTLFEVNYTRATGKPIVKVNSFEAVQGMAQLVVANSGVSSAVVKVNGSVVLAPKDFSAHPSKLQVNIEVAAANQLSVELRGAPGESLEIRIVQLQELKPTLYYLTWGGTQLRRVATDGSDQLIGGAPYPYCYQLSLAGSGAEIAVACGSGSDTQVWISNTSTGTSYKVADAPWCNHVSWLPDDTEVAFDNNFDGIHKVATSGGSAPLWIPVSQFAEFGKNAFRYGIRFSADRTRFVAGVGVAGGGGTEIFAGNIDFTTGTLSNILRLSPPAGFGWESVASGFDISADGETVFYGWRDVSAGLAQLWRARFDGSEIQMVWSRATASGDSSVGVNTVRFAPDGQRLWFTPCTGAGCSIANINLDGSDYQDFSPSVSVTTFALGTR